MKIIRLALVFASWAAFGWLSVAQTIPTGISFTWTNPTTPYGPPCASPAVGPCLMAPIIEDITSVTPVIISGTPSTIKATDTSFAYTFPSAPTMGSHSYVIIANGISAAGKAVSSVPSAPAVVDLEPVLNPLANLQVNVTVTVPMAAAH